MGIHPISQGEKRGYCYNVNTLIIPIVAGLGTILSFSDLHAVEVQARTFGGFTKGQQFTLTVTDKSSIRTSGTHVSKNVPVPEGMPDLAKGSDVTFTIGKGGRLKGPGFSILFESGKPRVNLYSNHPDGFSSEGEAAAVFKNGNGKPTGATLTFYRFRFSGFRPITHSVSYVLE